MNANPGQSDYLNRLGITQWRLRERDDAPQALVEVAEEVTASVKSEPPRQEVPQAAPASPVTKSRQMSRPAPPAETVTTARPAISADVSAMDWGDLQKEVAQCQACSLCERRKQAVFGVGVQDAPLLVIGEGPGADEDRLGEPFVGRAGQLLDRMLAAIGRDRKTNVYIANVVKCRPPQNRDPKVEEVSACSGYLDRQIQLIKPRMILALGRVAAQNLLKSDKPLGKLRGQQYSYGDVPLMVTYHPAYLLRTPRDKAKAWVDLKQIREHLQAEG